MYDENISTVDDIIDYILGMSMYCAERDGKYINFKPTKLSEYFNSETINGEYFENGEYKKIEFVPSLDDLEYLRSFKLEDLTFRGTVEFRSGCTQPVREIMALAAFHAGLIENLSELTELLNNDRVIYSNGYTPSQLRDMFNRGILPSFIDTDNLSKLLKQVVDIANDVLAKRNMNEQNLLTPLYSRAKYIFSPAKQMIDGISSGVPIEYYINDYSQIK
jgi:gamma-glutamylcysteine synthetase